MDAIRIQSKFVLDGKSCPLNPGQVVIRHGKIAQVTDSVRERPDLDLGDCVLMPGLVNVHTHLEFSGLPQPIARGQSFPDWIANVVQHRLELESQHTQHTLHVYRQQVYQSGLREAFCTGTSLIGDIVSDPWQANLLPSSETGLDCVGSVHENLAEGLEPVREISLAVWQKHLFGTQSPQVFAFPEMVGLTEARLRSTAKWAESLYRGFGDRRSQHFPDALVGVGVSPHAPYSLLFPAVEPLLGPFAEALTAMHVAESGDEMQWLQSGSGAFGECFERLGIPIAPELPSLDHMIDLLGSRSRSLLVHGNYLTSAHAERIGRSTTTSVVYCPRTHAYFQHSPYPLHMYREHGIRVVLATDSRASNPDLNLWSEVVQARRSQASMTPQEGFAAVTQEAAAALGMEHVAGSLEPGKIAHLNVVPCQPHWKPVNLLEEMTSQALCCTPLAVLWKSLPKA